MEILIRYFDGCPNWQGARDRLWEALSAEGMATGCRIAFERVASTEDADRLGFAGSPTILVNGADPFAQDGAPTGLTCRIYRTESGMQGSPSVAQLRALLSST
ncbi:MAG: thioredoxin family protein [Actinomycetota bacterium]